MNNAETSATAPNLAWFKSSYSGAEGGDCVEVATGTGVVHVRDSKTVAGPLIAVSPETWAGFVVLAASSKVV
jgi:hypothetical protein